jgi:hypothetical protein
MKMFRTASSVKILGLLMLLSLSVFCVKSAEPLKKNQQHAFPNYNAPPTSKELVKDKNFNYTAPLLSHALLESDPTRKLRKQEFMDTIHHAYYKITRGELEEIFNFMDMNKDDLVEPKEWDAFSQLFIFPFEACDKNGDNLLDEQEWKDCYDADPKSKLIEFRRRYQTNIYKTMMDVVTAGGDQHMNFADYLFLRKALFGWRQCHSNIKYIAKSHFKCAVSTALPPKYHVRVDFDEIYKTGQRLSSDRNLIELDFISYLRVTYYIYVFSVFSHPNDNPILQKTQWLKAVREDRMPNNFDEAEINMVFDLINNHPLNKNNYVATIDFQSWSFFFGLHRLFNKYSMEKPLQLKKSELLQLMSDPLVPKEIVMAIDESNTKFSEGAYQEASLVLQRLRADERNFFYTRFKAVETQDASFRSASFYNKSTINATFYDIHPNDTNREVFFSTLADTNKQFWTKVNLFRAFQLANLYIEIQASEEFTKTRNIPVTSFIELLPKKYDTVKPNINFEQRKNYAIYKSLPTEIQVDLLTFLALENYATKFRIHNMSTNELINETLLKVILADYGMGNMPDTVIDLGLKRYDTLRRRLYTPMDVAKYTLIVHAVACETGRSHKAIEDHKIKINNEISRKFPDLGRRFPSSDKV